MLGSQQLNPLSTMLRRLADVDNIVKFQRFCGLEWDEIPSTLHQCQCDLKPKIEDSSSEDDISNSGQCKCSDEQRPAGSPSKGKYESRTINGTTYRCNKYIHRE